MDLVSEKRRVYSIEPITVNSVEVTEVIIDPHYEEKHSSSINDQLILKLVKQLDGRQEAPQVQEDRYSYFATLIELSGKSYRLIWLQEEDTIYVGVINAYRDKRKK
jgi:hypothetical protein